MLPVVIISSFWPNCPEYPHLAAEWRSWRKRQRWGLRAVWHANSVKPANESHIIYLDWIRWLRSRNQCLPKKTAETWCKSKIDLISSSIIRRKEMKLKYNHCRNLFESCNSFTCWCRVSCYSKHCWLFSSNMYNCWPRCRYQYWDHH